MKNKNANKRKILSIHFKHKQTKYILILLFILLVLAITFLIINLNKKQENTAVNKPAEVKVEKKEEKLPPQKIYSSLLGMELKNKEELQKPVLGVMIENSVPARPQSGLKDAEVVFEAVAEGGITRFLALYQHNTSNLIGPVRSLRSYYLDWAGSYNASIAHVGGSYDALIRARDGHHRDMDQFFNDGTFWRSRDRYAPHNVYTTTNNLHQLAQKYNWNSSNFQGFSHRDDNKEIQKDAKQVNITISGYLYNSSYNYNQECNCYLRNQAGSPHLDREKGQISPKVLIAMKINNGRASDGYHTNYQTIGSGEAIVFQEGKAMAVEWRKDSENSPLYFKKDGKNFEFISGQKWIVAIGNYDGNMSWQQ